jgi:phosphoserine aminotransferase
MNFLNGGSADYVHSGTWATKAMGEAKKHGAVNTIWSGKADNFVRMPKPSELQFTDGAAYVHFTSNETIQGITMLEEPVNGDTPVFCDASSDFLSRPLDMSKYALLYAGAQKNVGPAGTAVVIIRDDMLAKVPEGLPSLLDYKLMAENDSLYNTPSSFIIYIIGEVTRWVLEEFGGLKQIAAHNEAKAALIYDLIDGSGGYYRGHAEKSSRSMMNISFRLPSEELEAKFIAESKAAGLDGLKGHRSVGGCRASIYNAMPVAGCEALRDFMAAFQKNNG